jgi:hypothetical protein
MELITSSKFTLNQLSDFINSIKDDVYIYPSPISGGSSIGKHIRHIIELYQSLFRDISSGVVDYDSRNRDISIEENKMVAIDALSELIIQIEIHRESRPIYIIENQTTTTVISNAVASSYERELMYNLEHCIHHIAIVAMIVRAEFPAIILEADFGKAYSTIRYEQSLICVQ